MFCLDRSDIFPDDDLALLVALGRLKRLETPAQARRLITHWSPWRSTGSLPVALLLRCTPVSGADSRPAILANIALCCGLPRPGGHRSQGFTEAENFYFYLRKVVIFAHMPAPEGIL